MDRLSYRVRVPLAVAAPLLVVVVVVAGASGAYTGAIPHRVKAELPVAASGGPAVGSSSTGEPSPLDRESGVTAGSVVTAELAGSVEASEANILPEGMLDLHESSVVDLYDVLPFLVDQPSERKGARLLAVIAAICVLGVTAAIIRAILAQRASGVVGT